LKLATPFNLFPDVRPPPPSAAELRRWTYRQCLHWCCDREGFLNRDRLRRVASARG